MKDLPRFRHRDYDTTRTFAAQMLTNHVDAISTLMRLTEREDHSFEAVFSARYFVLEDGVTEPTKSQWNSLKKRFKRSESSIFIFKDHGACACPDGEPGCFYLQFGYYAKRELDAPRPPQRPQARKGDTRSWDPPRTPPRRKSDR